MPVEMITRTLEIPKTMDDRLRLAVRGVILHKMPHATAQDVEDSILQLARHRWAEVIATQIQEQKQAEGYAESRAFFESVG